MDVAKAFAHYERTKRSEAALERKGEEKERALQARLGELRKMREGLALLSEQAREAKTREIDEKTDELKRLGVYTKRDLVQERDQIAQEIVAEIQRAIQEYAKANGFTLVLDERLLLYGQELYDLTEEVLQQLNARDAARATTGRRE